MRGSGLRSRLFRAIGVVVLICVALTIGLGLVLTRRAVETRDAAGPRAPGRTCIAASRAGGRVAVQTPAAAHRDDASSGSTRATSYDAVRSCRRGAQAPLAARASRRKERCTSGGDPYYFAARAGQPGRRSSCCGRRAPSARSCRRTSGGSSIAAAAGGLLAALAAFLLARRISRPVDRIAAAARTLTRGTHPEPVPVEGAAEIATLAVAFNELAAQLRQAQEAERNFLLSVSHELKTPLTAIRGYAEAVEDGAVDPREAAATVASEARRLERLVKDLLDLARMNRTDFSVTTPRSTSAEVAEDAVRRYEQQADELRRRAARRRRRPRAGGRRRRPRPPGRLEPRRERAATDAAGRRGARRRGARRRCASRTPAQGSRGRHASAPSSASTSTSGTAASGRSAPASASRS